MSEVIQINFGNFSQDLELVAELGNGAFGTVYLANDERGKQFAVKTSENLDKDSKDAASHEIQILIGLKHINITQMFAFDFHANKIVLVMEYCDEGNLNTRLLSKVTDAMKIKWMKELSQALIYLHKNNVVHRDLKPENVLLNNGRIKVSDFGIARFFYRGASIDNNLSEYVEAYMSSFAGTPYWIAPEVFDCHYTESADTFSLGILFYAILTRQYLEHRNTKYYGAFVKHNNKVVGLGLAMFEKGNQVNPTFESTENTEIFREIAPLILGMVKFVPGERISLLDCLEQLCLVNVENEEQQNLVKRSVRKVSTEKRMVKLHLKAQKDIKKSNLTNEKENNVAVNLQGFSIGQCMRNGNRYATEMLKKLIFSVFRGDKMAWALFSVGLLYVACHFFYFSSQKTLKSTGETEAEMQEEE